MGRGGALCPRTRAQEAALRAGLCFAGHTGGAAVGSVLRFVCRVCPKRVCCWACSRFPLGLVLRTIFCMYGELARRQLYGWGGYRSGSRVVFFHSGDQSQSQLVPASMESATRCPEPPLSRPLLSCSCPGGPACKQPDLPGKKRCAVLPALPSGQGCLQTREPARRCGAATFALSPGQHGIVCQEARNRGTWVSVSPGLAEGKFCCLIFED